MPTPNDNVSLLIGGQVHSAWSRYSIDSDLLIPADAWNVTLGLPKGDYPPAVQEGASVSVRVGNDIVMTGRIDQIDEQISKTAHTLSISGRDGAAVLVDCSAPIFVAKQISLAEIIANVVKPLGISKVKISADKTISAEKINVDPGISAWEVLVQAAAANGLWPWFEPDGTLVVGGPNYNTPPVAQLILRRNGQGNNVESLTRTRSIADRHSEYTVLGQSHGTDVEDGRNSLKQVVKDPAMKIYRPKIVVDHDAINAASALAKGRKLLSDSRLKGFTLTVKVQGHRTSDGVLWNPGQRIKVLSEPHGIDGIFFLISRRFEGGRGQGTSTTLTLKEDGVWTLDAHKKAKKGKSKASPTEGIALPVSQYDR